MKLDKYGVGQSQQSIQELAEAFYQYKENYKDESGQIYWKESDSAVSSKMSLKNRTNSRMVSFVSNDYLGFSQHPLVQSDAIRAINQFGTGFCAAPSIGGYSSLQKRLEQLINTNREKELFPKIVYTKNCAANRVNSYIIGPEGEIYKCWNDVSNPNMIVGYIDKSEITNPQLYYRYHSSCSCFNDPSCRECFYLPICNGKCSWYQLKNKYNGGQFNLCQCLLKAPGMRDKILEKYYDYVTQ